MAPSGFFEDVLLRPGPIALEIILKRCGITLDPAQLALLWSYHQLLRAANARLNLTRIHNFENMVLKHYVDSLLVLRFLDLPSPLVDMGSGPGLPGIPLKIASPQTRMILAEPRGARAQFLGETCAHLGLEGIEVYAHKLGPDYPGQVSGVISRAVGSVSETLRKVAACLAQDGRMIFMKGPDCEEEIAEAAQSEDALFELEADHAYEVPGTPHRRRLLVYRRLATEAPAQPPARLGRPDASPQFVGVLRELSSESNPRFRLFRDLLGGRGIRKHALALLAGPRITAEVLARFLHHVQGWLTDPDGPPPPDASIEWLRLSRPLFGELDVAGTNAPLLLVRVPPLEEWSDDAPWPQGCTLFIPFQDPENVGAVIRSAAAFSAARVVLLQGAAHPFHPRSCRAAGTALFQVPLLEGPPIARLQSRHVPLIALDTSGIVLEAEPFPERFGLVVGVEGPGLPDHLRQGPRRRIAIASGVESLNAATAAAIALYAWSKQQAGTSGL
ncbi:MAG: 16S rRNA (guanine(527)-N(7))-methyltransferase RsmG [Isosphaeraceae bacterium]